MKGLKKEFESSTVNEPSVFEPLRLYCICLSVYVSMCLCICMAVPIYTEPVNESSSDKIGEPKKWRQVKTKFWHLMYDGLMCAFV